MKQQRIKAYLILLFVALCVPVLSAKKKSIKRRKPAVALKKGVAKKRKKVSATRRKKATQSAAMRREYRDLIKSVTPEHVPSPLKNNFIRYTTGAVPLGIAGAGIYQLIKGNRLAGSGLLLGSIVASIARTRMLRSMTRKGANIYHQALYDYLNEWPEKREHIPEVIRGVIDRIHEDVTSGDVPLIYPEHAQALTDAIQAVGLIDQAQQKHTETEADKWEFVLNQLGLIGNDSTHKFAQLFAERTNQWFFWQALSIPIALASAFYFGHRIAPLRRYMYGVKSGFLQSQEQIAKRALTEQYHVAQEWPARLYGWADSLQERSSRVGTSIALPVLSVPLIGYIASLIAMRRSMLEAKRSYLDIFMSVWHSMKAHTPESLHERFDALYEKHFDTKSNKLILHDMKRNKFLKTLLREGQSYRSKTLEKQRSQQPKRSWFARLFRRGR